MSDIEKAIEEGINEMEEIKEGLNQSSKQDFDENFLTDRESTEFTVHSPIGDVKVDMLKFKSAKKNADKLVNPPQLSILTQKVQKFLGGQEETDFIYFRPRLGSLIKLHIFGSMRYCCVSTPAFEPSFLSSKASSIPEY